MANWKHSLAGVALAVTVAIGGTSALADTDLFSELEQAAQDSRELNLLQPLDVTTITRQEYAEINQQQIEEENPAEDIADWQQVLVFLGYIAPGDDILQIYTDLMSGQVLGFYDSETKELVVISTSESEWNVTDKSTFVHETTHAIQDQHFGIRTVLDPALESRTDDHYYAVLSLIEGDATISETIYLVRNDLIDQLIEEQKDMDFSGIDSAPLFLQETLLFPYNQGAEFVVHFWQIGGWNAVNQIWENPPTTTEQILHPEKYEEGEGAKPVAIADPTESMSDWRLLEYNENGELVTKIFLLNGGASDREASSAAEGWGGDAHYVITDDEGQTAMVWASTWDTEEDAQEFLDTLVEAESNRLTGTFDEVDSTTLRLTSDDWYAEIHHDGADVTYFVAQSSDTLEQLIASQEGATASPKATPEKDPATPVASVSFWVREE
ncbi:MAG: hypothetical protein M9953_00195 [Thermomicrobiales bacterium]|nr:hypothetical protein [Thermomicrobiales bacterium]